MFALKHRRPDGCDTTAPPRASARSQAAATFRRKPMSLSKEWNRTRSAPQRAAGHCAAAVLGAMALCLGCGLVGAQVPALPTSPVTINIVDVAGNLALTQDAIESYQQKHPQLVAKINFTKAPAPELPGKLKAMQSAGRSDIDMVLTGTDFLAAGIEQGVLVKLLPAYAAKFPNLMSNYIPAAAKMQELAQDYGITVVFMPAGPLVEYNPDQVKQVPTTPQELLAWCKAHPNRLIYARPANSGPGRTFIMGLPYLLGDKDPKDPVNGWTKTWAYLKELDSCIEYYPTGTGAVMKELGEGSRDMTITMTGWDINPRVLGIVPKSDKVAPFKNMTWVNDAHYMVIPKGVAPEKIAVVLDLMAYLLTPEAQAYTYDKGYFYPGPAVKGVTLAMAPKESQDAIKEFGRPEYEGWIAQFPHTQSLVPKAQVDAFRIWDQQVGAQKTK
jgi:putative spermidine/putrescine transport system substrate-binding protein